MTVLIKDIPSVAWVDVAPISTRNQFGQLLNDMGLTGPGVEIGTHRGEFAKILLDSWKGSLTCIDPWDNLPGYKEQEKMLWGTSGDRLADMVAASDLLKVYTANGRCLLIRMTSERAATGLHRYINGPLVFLSSPLDFVYLDGDHETDAVRLDIRLWWPKLKPGGMLAGHDFVCPGEKIGGWGGRVQPAVFEHARALNLPIKMVVEENGLPWSWYIIKP